MNIIVNVLLSWFWFCIFPQPLPPTPPLIGAAPIQGGKLTSSSSFHAHPGSLHPANDKRWRYENEHGTEAFTDGESPPLGLIASLFLHTFELNPLLSTVSVFPDFIQQASCVRNASAIKRVAPTASRGWERESVGGRGKGREEIEPREATLAACYVTRVQVLLCDIIDCYGEGRWRCVCGEVGVGGLEDVRRGWWRVWTLDARRCGSWHCRSREPLDFHCSPPLVILLWRATCVGGDSSLSPPVVRLLSDRTLRRVWKPLPGRANERLSACADSSARRHTHTHALLEMHRYRDLRQHPQASGVHVGHR